MNRRGAVIVLAATLAGACAHRPQTSGPWVRKVVLHGVRHVDESDLRRHMVTEETANFPWARRRAFDPFAVTLDEARIESYYRAHGFFDAKVVSTDVNPAREKGALNVEFNIDEGVATKIRALDTKGLDPIGDDAIAVFSNLDLRKGQIFDHPRYLSEKLEMRDRLKFLGYAWAEVDGQVVVDRDLHVADVTLLARPGPKATIRSINVTGAYVVEPRLLRRHSLLRRNELLTSDVLERARTKLYNLGFLSSVHIDYKHDPQHPEQADVTIDVNEAPFNEWRFGGGLSLELQRGEVRGRAEYTRHYWLGGLRRLRVRAEPAYVFVPTFWSPLRQGPAGTLEAEMTQYDVGWRPDELHVVAAYDLGVEYAFQYHGARVSLGYLRNFLHDRLQIGIGYNFQFLLFFNTDPALLTDPALSARDYGFVDPYRVAWLDQSITLDLRDAPLDTRKGGWFSLRAEEGGVWTGGDFTYEKVVAEVRGYYPIWRRFVVAARTEFGHIFTQGKNGSPTTRRFYLGGPESHRGFNFNRLSEQIPSGIKGNPALPIGGDEMFLTDVELRARAVRLFGSWLEFAAFMDAGDVAAPNGLPHDHVDLGELHVAVGGGVRYKTAIGTIRFDVGVRVNRLGYAEPDGRMNPDAHQPVAYHLSIGEPF